MTLKNGDTYTLMVLCSLVSLSLHVLSPYNRVKLVYEVLNIVRKKAKTRNPYNKIPQLTQDTIWQSDEKQEKIMYKRSALSKQVTTMLQGIDRTV